MHLAVLYLWRQLQAKSEKTKESDSFGAHLIFQTGESFFLKFKNTFRLIETSYSVHIA